jgi:hypothetical protein
MKSPRPPLQKGEIFGVLQKGGDIWAFAKGGDILAFGKGGGILGFGKGGDIPRLFSDRMPKRIACRQVSENSRTFPPFVKGGSGGISHETHMTVSVTKQDENG